MADEARETILDGKNLRESTLGGLILGAINRQESFYLFWGDDFQDLPEPDSEAELIDVITEQLNSDGSWNCEIYVLWLGGT